MAAASAFSVLVLLIIDFSKRGRLLFDLFYYIFLEPQPSPTLSYLGDFTTHKVLLLALFRLPGYQAVDEEESLSCVPIK